MRPLQGQPCTWIEFHDLIERIAPGSRSAHLRPLDLHELFTCSDRRMVRSDLIVQGAEDLSDSSLGRLTRHLKHEFPHR
ncbi:hypothetical protein ES5_16702 [Dietzia cinnamea P4]|nr:hypothetical protein ES5_16702 [Dietzia cinnamea P4]